MRARWVRQLTGSGATGLVPGFIDAALSSLAGFAASLYAARFLAGDELGAFALYFGAASVAAIFPANLIFLPARLIGLDAAAAARVTVLRQSVWAGVILAAITVIFTLPIGVVVAADVSNDVLLALAVSAIPFIVVSPLQDHIRATFYFANRPNDSAAVAGVHFVVTLAAVVALHVGDVEAAWVPFSALALGNIASSVLGLWLAYGSEEPVVSLPGAGALMRSGKLLLPTALINEGANLASSVVLAGVASAEVLGKAEAARIVTRPVAVLALGFARSLSPRLMEAGRARSRSQARSTSILYAAALACSSLAVLAAIGFEHPLNPFPRLIPLAYEVEGLLALTILTTAFSYMAFIPRPVILGAGQNAPLLLIAISSTLARIITVGLLASYIGSYAMPAGLVAFGVLGGVLSVRQSGRVLASDKVS